MILKKALIGLATTGLLSLGGTGAAFAATAPPTTPSNGTSPPVAKGCKNADKRVDHLQALRGRVENRIDHLQKAIEAARDHHNDDLVKKLEARLDRASKIRDAINDRIQKLVSECHVTAPTNNAPATTAPPTTQAA